MKLKKHGAFLVNFVINFANGDMSHEEFDMDYSGYVIEHFATTPKLGGQYLLKSKTTKLNPLRIEFGGHFTVVRFPYSGH